MPAENFCDYESFDEPPKLSVNELPVATFQLAHPLAFQQVQPPRLALPTQTSDLPPDSFGFDEPPATDSPPELPVMNYHPPPRLVCPLQTGARDFGAIEDSPPPPVLPALVRLPPNLDDGLLELDSSSRALVKCERCQRKICTGQTTLRLKPLIVHTLCHHLPTHLSPYSCSRCGRRFRHREKGRRHVRDCSGHPATLDLDDAQLELVWDATQFGFQAVMRRCWGAKVRHKKAKFLAEGA